MNGQSTIIIDDATSARKKKQFRRAGRRTTSCRRSRTPASTRVRPTAASTAHPAPTTCRGVQVANIYQQDWFRDVTTKVVLPRFAASGKPFALVYWSRDPDGTQHNTGDSLNETYPGINGPTSLAAVRNASDNLHALIDELKTLGLYDNTDIFVTADHGFSTISRQSENLVVRQIQLSRRHGEGFSCRQASSPSTWPTRSTCRSAIPTARRSTSKKASILPVRPSWAAIRPIPKLLVVSAGGSDILYLDPAKAKDLAPKIVAALSHEDYVGGLFVSDDLGNVAGALPMSAARLIGTSLTPRPAIYVAFSDHADATCVVKWQNPELCSALIADGGLQQGQGQHGSFTRANTHNFMAAMGPRLQGRLRRSRRAISNADITPTLAHVLGFDPAVYRQAQRPRHRRSPGQRPRQRRQHGRRRPFRQDGRRLRHRAGKPVGRRRDLSRCRGHAGAG
ncbi:MAG: alkaline phosphatase family protein [Asticcacaulis sp.]